MFIKFIISQVIILTLVMLGQKEAANLCSNLPLGDKTEFVHLPHKVLFTDYGFVSGAIS